MAVILEEQIISGFVDGECFKEGILPIAGGETYKIVWDGVEYELIAFEMNGGVAVGNKMIIGEQDSGEPFVIATAPAEVTGSTDMILIASTDTSAESHIVAIYTVEEEKGVTIILYDRTGGPVTHEGVETITTDTPDAERGATFTYGVVVDNVEYEPNFSNGNQKVTLKKGQLLKEFTLKKPETLLPEHIKKGVEVAGVLGDFAGDETEKTVELNMADGNQVIEADEDTVMTKVTVNKPVTMLQENIKKDVEIGGVIGTFIGDGQEKTVVLAMAEGNQIIEADQGTVLGKVIVEKPKTLIPSNIADGIDIGGVVGTLKAGGGSSSGYTVKVIDYDGTVIVEEKHATGDTFTLPDAPTHERLVFDSWSSPVEIIDNTITVEDYDILIGATYYTASGATEIDIEANVATGLTFGFYSTSVLTGYTSIDWGDGTTGTSASHTYSDYGKYTIKIYGMTKINSSSAFVSSSYGGMVERVFVGNTVTSIGKYAFRYCASLRNVVMPSSVKSIDSHAFYQCYALESVAIPLGVTSIGSSSFYQCYALESVAIPLGVTSIGSNAFQSCQTLRSVVIPSGVTSIGSSSFRYCYSLKNIVIPSGVTSIGSYAFQQCYALESVAIPLGVTSIFDFTFSLCNSLRNVVIPSGITAIGREAFANCFCVEEYNFANYTEIPTLTANAFSNITKTTKIKVPASLYDSWIAATNWSTYANYIVAV